MRYDHIQEFNTFLTNQLPTIDAHIARHKNELDRLTRLRTLVAQFASTEVSADATTAINQTALAKVLDDIATGSPAALAATTANMTSEIAGATTAAAEDQPVDAVRVAA